MSLAERQFPGTLILQRSTSMSIYTYKFHKAMCDVLGTEYYEDLLLSDQEIDVIPEDAKNYGISGGITPTTWKSGNVPWNKGRKVSEEERLRLKKMCENRVPWNKGKTGVQKHSEEWKQNHSAKLKGKKQSEEHKLKNSLAQKGKPRPYLKRDSEGKFI